MKKEYIYIFQVRIQAQVSLKHPLKKRRNYKTKKGRNEIKV